MAAMLPQYKTAADVEADLRNEFADMLGMVPSSAGIFVQYAGEDSLRRVFGVPYEISDGYLVVGPYLLDQGDITPSDFSGRTMRIPLGDIRQFRRLNVNDFLWE